MLLELRRSGGFTGTPKRWRVDAGDDPQWRTLIDQAGLQYRGPVLRVLRIAFAWVPGASHPDYVYDIWVDGRRASFRGVDVTGGLSQLVDRIVNEGEEIDSRGVAPSG
jgi:hypothetical protein